MQPFLRSATSALRQGAAGAAAAAASQSSSSAAAASASSSRLLGGLSRCSVNGYATQAGQPMPPPPPSGGSGSGSGSGSGGKKSKKGAAVTSPAAAAPEPSHETTNLSEARPAAVSSSAAAPINPNASPAAMPAGAADASDPATTGAAPIPINTQRPLEPPASSPTPLAEAPAPTASNTSLTPSASLVSQYLDATEVPASPQERTGARSTAGKRPESSIDRKRRNLGRATLGVFAVGAGAVAWSMGREWDSEKEKLRLGRNVTIEEGLEGRWQRGQARFWDTLDYFNKPAWEPLLPDVLPPPHQKPYTLVLSLDDLLIHSSWSREHGWRTAKRPGLHYFLAYLSQFYEIVLFTSQPAYTAIPIVEKLDPHGIFVLYKLYRDCTRYSKEHKDVIKDLSYLGRDLSKVVQLDTVPTHVAAQPENAYTLKPWKGNRDDTDLVAMIPFLEAISIYAVPDVRPVLTKYRDTHIPTAWAEVERKQKQAALDQWEQSQAGKKGKLGGGFGSLFGGGGATKRETGPPKTALELGREFYQKSYLEEQKWWAEQKPIIEQAMKEDQEKAQAAMTSSVATWAAALIGMPPPPPPEQAAQASQSPPAAK